MASNNIEVLDPAATVEKLRKIVSGVEMNRRHFMAALGVAGVAAGTGLVSGPVARAQQPTPTGYTQLDVLNFLLNVKYLSATFNSFITQGVDLPATSFTTLSSSQVYNQPAQVSFSAYSNASQLTDMFNEIYYDDLNHLIDLRNLVIVSAIGSSALGTAAGYAVVAPRPTLNLMGTSAANVAFSAPSTTTVITAAQAIAMARMFEDLCVTAFTGSLAYLTGANLAAAAQVLAADGCHASALRLATIQTGAPYQGTFYVGPSFQIATTAGTKTLYMPSTSASSTTINGVSASHPAVGDAITGFGIPVGATITSIANMTLSNLTATAPSGYLSTKGSPTLTLVGTAPTGILPGMTITGAPIPAFTYITGVPTSPAGLTISNNATASSVETPTGIFTAGTGLAGGNTANNPALITAISSETGLYVGRAISAASTTGNYYVNPSSNTTISTTAVNSTSSNGVGTITLLMSAPCLQSSFVTVTGTISANSSIISNVVFGLNSSGATGNMAMVVPTTQPVIVGTSASPIDPVAITATVTSGSKSVTGIASTTGLTVGQPVYGPNIPSGTTITTINSATAITLSTAATAASTSFLICSVLPPNTLITATSTTANTITLNANAASSYTGTFSIPWAVPVTIASVTTDAVTIGRANITISEAATATGSGTAVILSPAGDADEVAPVDPGAAIIAASGTSAAAAAASAAGPGPVPYNTPTSVTPGLNQGFFATAGTLNGSGGTPAGFAFARTFSQVLTVLYGNTTPGTYDGGYFPASQPNGDSTNTGGGVSGNIAVV